MSWNVDDAHGQRQHVGDQDDHEEEALPRKVLEVRKGKGGQDRQCDLPEGDRDGDDKTVGQQATQVNLVPGKNEIPEERGPRDQARGIDEHLLEIERAHQQRIQDGETGDADAQQ
jgi:hypothetical protein